MRTATLEFGFFSKFQLLASEVIQTVVCAWCCVVFRCLHNVQKIKRTATFNSCSQFLFSFWNIQLEVFCNPENQYRIKAINNRNQFSM
jgi:hypothetical protein